MALQSHGIGYAEYAPQEPLKDIVYCYWELEDKRSSPASYVYKALADGCTDLFFNVHDLHDSQVLGFFQRYQSFPLPAGFHYAGIRFFPGCFHSLFYKNAFEDPSIEHALEEVLPELFKKLPELISVPGDAHSRWTALQGWFINALQTAPVADLRVLEAIHGLLKNYGSGNLQEHLNTGLSPRQMRRLFHQYVGGTPKLLARVARFQMVLRALFDDGNVDIPHLFLNAGFYDQAHFSKEFKSFYGVAPAQIYQHLWPD